MSTISAHPIKVLVVTPLKLELNTLRAGFQKLDFPMEVESCGELPVYHIPDLNLRLSLGGHGKTQYALQCQYLLDRLPGVTDLVCVGAAGGLDDSLDVGDLILARETVEHDFRVRFVSREQPRFLAVGEVQADVLTYLQKHQSDIRWHHGVMASGDEDVVDADARSKLHQRTGAVAVAWEGSGGARTARFNQTGFMELRVITDDASSVPPQNSFVQTVSQGMVTVARVLSDVLQQTDDNSSQV